MTPVWMEFVKKSSLEGSECSVAIVGATANRLSV